jgi:hypothetical protein
VHQCRSEGNCSDGGGEEKAESSGSKEKGGLRTPDIVVDK